MVFGMRKLIVLTALFAVAAGCAVFAAPKHGVITFVESSDKGQVRTLKIGLTDAPAKTCLSGDWRAAKVLEDPARYTRKPAYELQGKNLELLLVNGVCDGYDSYVGKLEGTAFKGEHVAYGLGHNRTLGAVSGTYAGAEAR